MRQKINFLVVVIVAATITTPSHAQMSGMKHEASQAGAHLDHNPKHGGTFFMAMDNRHHLEGVLVAPGILRIYLYDAHTKPVGLAELRQVKGTVQWGDAPDALEIPLVVSKTGEFLEAQPETVVKLPVELTLRLHLPGEPLKNRPELFTFPFSHFTATK